MYENFWAAVTFFGNPIPWIAIVTGLILVYMGMKWDYIHVRNREKVRHMLKHFLLLMIPVLFLSLAGSEMLKVLLHIPRPCIACPAAMCNPYCPASFSFPSSHTATITGVVTALVLLLRKRKYLVLYALPVLIAVSRVELAVHTITDVTGGFFTGLLLTLLVWKYRKRIYKWEDEIV